MKLKDWRTAKNLSLEELARLIGVANESVARRYESGARMPKPRIIEEISKVTRGKVTFEDHLAAVKARQVKTAPQPASRRSRPSTSETVPA